MNLGLEITPSIVMWLFLLLLYFSCIFLSDIPNSLSVTVLNYEKLLHVVLTQIEPNPPILDVMSKSF